MSMNRKKSVVLGIMLTGLLAATPLLKAAEDAAADTNQAPEASGTMPAMSKQQMMQMETQMLKMHKLMNQIIATKDPAKREKLQQEHMRLMEGQMQMMMPMMMSMMQGGMMGKDGKMDSSVQGGMGNMDNMGNMDHSAPSDNAK